MRETGGFYVGKFDPVGFVGDGFDVECVAELSLVGHNFPRWLFFFFLA